MPKKKPMFAFTNSTIANTIRSTTTDMATETEYLKNTTDDLSKSKKLYASLMKNLGQEFDIIAVTMAIAFCNPNSNYSKDTPSDQCSNVINMAELCAKVARDKLGDGAIDSALRFSSRRKNNDFKAVQAYTMLHSMCNLVNDPSFDLGGQHTGISVLLKSIVPNGVVLKMAKTAEFKKTAEDLADKVLSLSEDELRLDLKI
jgi:hypothetical protein